MAEEVTREENDELLYLEKLMAGKISPGESSDDGGLDEEIGYVSAPIDSLGPPGRWIRHKLLESILYGTPVLLAIQHLRSKQISRLMKFASILGTEEFYVVLICFLLWIVDMRLARLCCIAMAIGFYSANFVKNSFCLPRPPSPPVKPLENAYYTWGLPSHHSVLAVVCPWYIWFYCLLHYHLEFTTLVCLFSFIALWSSNVLICRVYNGVHSPADVVAGGLLGCLIVTFMNRYDNLMDLSSSMNGQGALLVPLYGAILLVLHPNNEIGLSAYIESTSMVSAAIGMVLGRAFSHSRSPAMKTVIDMYKPDETSITLAIGVGIARYILGAAIVLLTKVILKLVAQAVIACIMKLADIKYYTKTKTSVYYTGYSKNYRLPPIFDNKKKDNDDDEREREKELRLRNIAQLKQQEPWNISHAVRFVTYIGMGFMAYATVPQVFSYTGLVF